MLNQFLSKISVPIQEHTLAGGNGIWNREVLPDIVLEDKDAPQIKLTGIGYDLIQQNNLPRVIERQIAREMDIPSFELSREMKRALRRFSKEYRLLRENGMDGLLRAAKKDGVTLCFSTREVAERDAKEGVVASWWHSRNAIVFNANNYFINQNSYRHNSLAHELGHYIEDDRNNPFSINFSRIMSTTDFGKFWGQFVLAMAFKYTPKYWKEAHIQKAKDLGREFSNLCDASAYAKNIALQAYTAQRYQEEDLNSELLCRMLAYLGTFGYGEESMKKKNNPLRPALAILNRLAEAYANGNSDLYASIVETIQTYQIPDLGYQVAADFEKVKKDLLEKLADPKNQSDRKQNSALYRSLERAFYPFQDWVRGVGGDLLRKVDRVIQDHPSQQQEQASVRSLLEQHSKTKLTPQADMTKLKERNTKRQERAKEQREKSKNTVLSRYPLVKVER